MNVVVYVDVKKLTEGCHSQLLSKFLNGGALLINKSAGLNDFIVSSQQPVDNLSASLTTSQNVTEFYDNNKL